MLKTKPNDRKGQQSHVSYIESQLDSFLPPLHFALPPILATAAIVIDNGCRDNKGNTGAVRV